MAPLHLVRTKSMAGETPRAFTAFRYDCESVCLSVCDRSHYDNNNNTSKRTTHPRQLSTAVVRDLKGKRDKGPFDIGSAVSVIGGLGRASNRSFKDP